MNNRALGNKGEKLAKKFLEDKGDCIVETNFLCRFGEIDIIATLDGELSFIEVKTRGQELYGCPSESVNYLKRRHIYKVAEYYLYKEKIVDVPISLDVIEIYILNKDNPRIIHYKNAIIEKPRQVRKMYYGR